MATGNNIEPTLESVAALLGLSVDELSTTLNAEYRIIKSDVMELRRHPQQPAEFIKFALEKIAGIASDKRYEKYVEVLKRIIHRDEPRKLYFFNNDLEAISRILFFIDHEGQTEVALDNLDLHSLPFLLRRTRNLQTLNISKNKIHNLSIISTLRDLRVLIADDNLITDIGPLKAAQNLQLISLNNNFVKTNFPVFKELPLLKEVQLAGNRINNDQVKLILESQFIQKISLENNPIDAPKKYLTDIASLRSFFNIDISVQANDPATETVQSQAPIEEKVEHLKVHPDDNYTPFDANSNDLPPVAPAAEQPKDEVYPSYAIRKVILKGNPDKVLLDIEKLSGIFYDLIANSDNNGEHFFGLFGRWGRGKTFFWNYIKANKLNQNYIPIEFHAWKYQDTPGVWAYLYNELNTIYYTRGKNGKKINPVVRFVRLLKLNWLRGKIIKPVLLFTSTAMASVLLYIFLINKIDFLKRTEISIIAGFGYFSFTLYSLLSYLQKNFKDDAKKIVFEATANVSFKTQLGMQYEIQHELKCLLKAWIPEKVKNYNRVFLFIDDIDRCSEDKIIQIVDYIRVLLHDKEIQDRITVLAAIDERILLHAIQHKYKQFIENKDNDATYKELCREYMDKLFLAGLKLGPLTEYEKRQIVEGFTGADTSSSQPETQRAANGIDSHKVAEIISQANATGKSDAEASLENNSQDALTNVLAGTVPPFLNTPKTINPVEVKTAAIPVTPTPIASTAQIQFPYEKWEQEFIKDILARNTESTPRSIRVYTYRYLLGKQLVEKALTEGKTSYTQWYNTKEAKQCFAIKLLHYGFKSDTDRLLIDYKSFITDYDETRAVKESIYGYEISLNQELGSIMFQVLTMIIAY